MAVFVSLLVRDYSIIYKEESSMSAPSCPECGAEILIPANAMAHELLPCPDCGTELEIISLNPVTLDRAPEVEEDWGE